MKKKIERYLSHEVTDGDMADIRQWFESDTALGVWLRDGIERSPNTIDASVDARIRARIARAIESGGAVSAPSSSPRRRLHGIRTFVDIAAAIAVVIALGISINIPSSPAQVPVVVTTDRGQRSNVTLPDGTHVAVNSMSELTYKFDPSTGRRHVALNGEAYFDVAPDERHPFIVTCDGIEVECKGTEYDVKNYSEDDHIAVVLHEGKVVVSDGSTAIAMKADMMVRYDKAHRKFSSQRVLANDYSEWQSGVLRFNDERMCDIAKTLSRTWGVSLEIDDPDLREERFTGSVGSRDLSDCLKAIAKAGNADYRLESDSVVRIFKVLK